MRTIVDVGINWHSRCYHFTKYRAITRNLRVATGIRLIGLQTGCTCIRLFEYHTQNRGSDEYWIYNIQTDKGASEVSTAVIEALQSKMSSVNVSRNIPPSPKQRYVKSDTQSLSDTSECCSGCRCPQ